MLTYMNMVCKQSRATKGKMYHCCLPGPDFRLSHVSGLEDERGVEEDILLLGSALYHQKKVLPFFPTVSTSGDLAHV